MDFDTYRLGAGIIVAATTGGVIASLPLLTDGQTSAPRFVRVMAKANASFRFENGGTANVTLPSDPVLASNFPEIFSTGGNRCISAKTKSGIATLSVTAIEL